MDKWEFLEKGGMNSLDVWRNKDGTIYVHATGSHWENDDVVFVNLTPEAAKELAEFIVRTTPPGN
jgi:hypothetical protein